MVAEVELTFTETLSPQNVTHHYVTITIFEDKNRYRFRRRTQISEIPCSLTTTLSKWQQSFQALVDPFLMDNDDDLEITCNCWQSYQRLIAELNQWLNQDSGWQKITQWLRKEIAPNQLEIYLLIQTENRLLQQLPWQDWSFIQTEYPQTEIALSSSEYQISSGWQGLKPHVKVRILVVLGANDDLNLQEDEQLFHQLKLFGATIQILKQPHLEELKDILKEPPGWHIFFYGGHSETLEEGTGLLWLNNVDPPIPIEQLEASFQIAINQGLHLGIFNSCNGLGLANYLTQLSYPQLIVMRQLIPNKIAVTFLERFLFNYSRNYSLIASLHKAKWSLRSLYHTSDYYPGIHQLPILYSNPALPLPKWKTFQKINNFSQKEILLISALFLIAWSLPLSLKWEFKKIDIVILYAKIYPHIITFPAIFFGGFLWCLFKSFRQLVNRKRLQKAVIIILIISSLVVYVELTAPNMLLFEFNQTAETIVSDLPAESIIKFESITQNTKFSSSTNEDKTFVFRQKDLQKSLVRLVTSARDSLSKEEKASYYEYMNRGLNFRKTWQKAENWQSWSRLFYSLIVGLTSFSLLILLFLWIQLLHEENINNYITYLGYLSFSQLLICLWIPFRSYYNLSIKPLIFDQKIYLSGFDFIVYLTLASILIVTIFILFRLKQYLLALMTLLAFLLIILLSMNPLNIIIDYTFGLNTIHEMSWFLYPILVIVVLFIWSQIVEHWQS